MFQAMFAVPLIFLGTAAAANIVTGSLPHTTAIYNNLAGMVTNVNPEDLVSYIRS
jgi:hypothetical protein